MNFDYIHVTSQKRDMHTSFVNAHGRVRKTCAKSKGNVKQNTEEFSLSTERFNSREFNSVK